MKIRVIRRNCTFCRSLFSLRFHDMICVTVYVFRAVMNKIALKKVCSISKNLLTKASVCSIITYVAGITQLVEYLTRNEEVEGSSPFSSSWIIGNRDKSRFLIFYFNLGLEPARVGALKKRSGGGLLAPISEARKREPSKAQPSVKSLFQLCGKLLLPIPRPSFSGAFSLSPHQNRKINQATSIALKVA